MRIMAVITDVIMTGVYGENEWPSLSGSGKREGFTPKPAGGTCIVWRHSFSWSSATLRIFLSCEMMKESEGRHLAFMKEGRGSNSSLGHRRCDALPLLCDGLSPEGFSLADSNE